MRTNTPCRLLRSRRRFVLILACLLTSSAALASDAGNGESSSDGEGQWVTSLTVLGGEQQNVAMATADGLLLRESSVWTAPVGSPNEKKKAFTQPVASWAVAATPDGATLFSSDYRGNLTVYNVSEQSETRHEGVFERWTRALASGPDGKQLVAGNEAGKLFLWDVAEGKVAKGVELGENAIMDIAFAEDGKSLAAADGAGQVHFLKWPELEVSGKAAVSEEAVWSVCYEADGKHLLAGAADNHLYRLAAEPEAEAKSIAKASDWITDVARSPQGTIAAGELGGRVHLLAADGTPIGAPLEAASGVWTLCWTDSGSLLVGTRKDGVQVVEQKWGWVESAGEAASGAEESE